MIFKTMAYPLCIELCPTALPEYIIAITKHTPKWCWFHACILEGCPLLIKVLQSMTGHEILDYLSGWMKWVGCVSCFGRATPNGSFKHSLKCFWENVIRNQVCQGMWVSRTPSHSKTENLMSAWKSSVSLKYICTAYKRIMFSSFLNLSKYSQTCFTNHLYLNTASL